MDIGERSEAISEYSYEAQRFSIKCTVTMNKVKPGHILNYDEIKIMEWSRMEKYIFKRRYRFQSVIYSTKSTTSVVWPYGLMGHC